MVDPCRTEVLPAPTPRVRVIDDPKPVDRALTRQVVRIGGKDFEETLLDKRVLEVDVEENCSGLSVAKVVLLNEDLKLTDDESLQVNLDVEIFTGYANTSIVKRGDFITTVPRFLFSGDGPAEITLHCYSQEWLLANTERRVVYQNIRDSEIAERIAARYSLDADVQVTSPLYEHISQVGISDYSFLQDRARLYGYEFYVEEGVLHFHEPRFVDSGLKLFYADPSRAELGTVEMTVDPWIFGAQWRKSGVDRISGQVWEFTSDDSLDPVASQIVKKAPLGFKRASTLASLNNERPRRFIIGDGHLDSPDEGLQQVRGYTRSTEWIVHGSAVSYGIETLKARQVVELVGLGHLSGHYYVKAVRHFISRGYEMKFEITRPGIGDIFKSRDNRLLNERSSRDRENVVSLSPRVGSVVIG